LGIDELDSIDGVQPEAITVANDLINKGSLEDLKTYY
jgi:hypothetical protein